MRMSHRLGSIALAFAAMVILPAMQHAHASAQRTFVASTGNDTHPCSLTQPCRSFTAAIAQTFDSGEVIVLDWAGYGPMTITKRLSIIAPPGVYAGISVGVGQTGVLINAANIDVTLRGLSINSTGGDAGIAMANRAMLVIENCVISNFIDGIGVKIQTGATVNISNTVIRNTQVGITAGFGATVNVANSHVLGVSSEGILITGASAATTNMYIVDTVVTGVAGFANCIDNFAGGPGAGNISATRVTVSGCNYSFINETAGGGTMIVSNSMATGNVIGFGNASGVFRSLGTNHVSGNGTDKTGTITVIPQS